MLLADTSIWIDHLRAADAELGRALAARRVVTHPFVIGELALGTLRDRATVIAALSDLRRLPLARPDEVLAMIDNFRLFGRGIGYVDAHLLASVRLAPGAQLWTRDRRLAEVATELGGGAR